MTATCHLPVSYQQSVRLHLFTAGLAILRHCAPSCIFEKLAGSMELTPGLNDTIQNRPTELNVSRPDDVMVERFSPAVVLRTTAIKMLQEH